MDWNEIDKIEREVNYEKFQPKERRKIPPSVEKILSDFDKLASEDIPTEETFHQDHEKAVDIPQRNYLQKALRKTLRWQSFCQANP